MDGSRRGFLKIVGLTALGLTTRPSPNPLQAQEEAGPAAYDQPVTAKRWAMVVDLRKMDEHGSWQRCIDACHRTHNVPTFDEPKDEITWMWEEDFHTAFHEQNFEFVKEELEHVRVPLLCNHCDNPPCTKVCPTGATWKRESDGIVMMDWHRCIGCRYCVVACPYGSRSFNWRDPRPNIPAVDPAYPTRMRGVVEKCTFCEERLAKGQLPACVEACEHGEIVFGDLEDPSSAVRALLHENFTIRRKPGLGTQPEVYYIV